MKLREGSLIDIDSSSVVTMVDDDIYTDVMMLPGGDREARAEVHCSGRGRGGGGVVGRRGGRGRGGPQSSARYRDIYTLYLYHLQVIIPGTDWESVNYIYKKFPCEVM